jgi:hypothetical protein
MLLQIRFPRMALPKVTLPRMALPKVKLPRMALPKVKFPRTWLPRIKFPRIPFPQLKFPRTWLPRIKFPRLGFLQRWSALIGIGLALTMCCGLVLGRRMTDQRPATGIPLGATSEVAARASLHEQLEALQARPPHLNVRIRGRR